MTEWKVGDKIMAPYKKFTWLDQLLWRLFRYQLKRKPEMRQYVVLETITSASQSDGAGQPPKADR